MKLAVPKETAPHEARVSLVPETVAKLVERGVEVRVASGAGAAAAFSDELYESAGAHIAREPGALLSGIDLLVGVGRPDPALLAAVAHGTAVLALLAPLGDPGYVSSLAQLGLTALSMDAIPRITRAQPMDALSSQSNIAGYKAVLLAAGALPKFFPMLTTAAGTIPPAKVLVLGAGVAGLQAIATARRLGAVVSAYDARSVVREQVQSLGATFVDIPIGDAQTAGGYARALTEDEVAMQQSALATHAAAADVMISTALVPGRRAPLLLTQQAVDGLRAGSVIIDLAAETGGNCAVTVADSTVVTPNGVTVIGPTNLPATMPQHASQLYSRNVSAFLALLVRDGAFVLDMDDEIVRGTTLVRNGEVVHEATRAALAGAKV